MGDVPVWVQKLAGDLAEVWGLHSWRIDLMAVKRPGGKGDPDADGTAAFDTHYLTADIRVRPDIKPDDYGVEVVAHELLHLVFSELRDTAAGMAKQAAGDNWEQAMAAYDRAEERTITVIARGLARRFDLGRGLVTDEDYGRVNQGQQTTPGHAATLPDAAGGSGPAGGGVASPGETGLGHGPNGKGPAVHRAKPTP